MILRPFTARDRQLLQHLFSDPEVTRHLPWGHPFSIDETEARLRELLNHWRRYSFGTYAVKIRTSGRLIGYTGLEVVEGRDFVELLYALSKIRWGQGFACEAAAACVKHGFDVLGLKSIVGVTAPGNKGSRRVLRKLGMKPSPALDFYGRWLSYYSLSRNHFVAGPRC